VGGNDQTNVQQEIDTDTDLFEIIIFELSPILGGRSEVLATPFYEVLKHVELNRKKKVSDRWNKYMDNVYSNFQNLGDSGRKKIPEYVKMIQPEQARKQLKLQTNVSQLEQLLKEQEERARSNQGG
jgi:hypothetical protein